MDEPSVGAPASGKSINSLVMNCLLPGLGSLYAGRVGLGSSQLGLAVTGVFLVPIFFIGIPLIVAAYVWSIYSGVRRLSE